MIDLAILMENNAPKKKLLFFSSIVDYLELIRFSHTLFALPFAFLSAAMAFKLNLLENPPLYPKVLDFIGILLCMVFARSAAMGFNRWADQKIDAQNPRTAMRHIPAGKISSVKALRFVIFCSLAFILSTLLFLPNRIPIFASLPVLLFLFGYSYTKRWTVAAHFWLGAALMLAPMAAWIVVRPTIWPIPWAPIVLGLAVLFWSAGFDLIYACQDAGIDAQNGLFSIPGKYGVSVTFRIAAVCHALAMLLFIGLYCIYAPFSKLFGVGIAAVALILLAEHCLAAPKKNKEVDLFRINIAFFHMNAVISLLLLTVGLVDLFLWDVFR